MAAQLLLTEEEKAEYKAKFDKFDENGDGTIPTRMLKFAMTAMGHDLTEAELENYVAKGNETTTYSELLTMIEVKVKLAGVYKIYSEAFLAVDKDGSNRLCADELRQAMFTVDPSMTEEDINAMIEKFDFNEDGKLNLLEFMQLIIHYTR
ncbi:calcium-binding protein SPEC 2D [Strongylocentrotus purpuratus]|uniref:EF-hand domain-containing protein n=1 Tax=Strongylocentrotus purpuratus TaxID=7668 RepID=A0A7M7RES8_STRPU|nr:calcium-binding protein SPEC 2D [Strongylocentrotus purpuratus]